MRHTACAAEDLSVHHHRAVAVVLRRKASFQRRRCQHRLEHRPHRIRLQGPVQEGAVRRFQTGRRVSRVKTRHTDAGPQGCRADVQHQNAAGGHGLRRHRLGRPLDRTGDGQADPHRSAVRLQMLHLLPGAQVALRGHRAQQGVPCPAAGEQRVQCFFQPGSTVALTVQIPQQLRAQRCGYIPPGAVMSRSTSTRNGAARLRLRYSSSCPAVSVQAYRRV